MTHSITPSAASSVRPVDQLPAGAPAFSLSLAADPTDPATLGRPAWTMQGANGTDRLHAQLSPAEAATAGSPGGLGLDLALATAKPAVLEGGAGWIDFGAGRRLLLLLADGPPRHGFDRGRRTHAAGRWDGLVRPPVGRLHRRRRRRLGLVRGQPGRRHRPHPVARPGGRRDGCPGLRNARRQGRHGHPPRPIRLQRGRHPSLDIAGHRGNLPGRLDDLDPQPGARRSTSYRRSPTRSSTRGRRPGSSTGKARRSSAQPEPGRPRADRATSS